MARLVKKLKYSNKAVIFDRGSFDDWCVYVIDNNNNRKAPYDEVYFNDLQEISFKYKSGKIYDDFLKIYELTTTIIDENVIDIIDYITETYNIEDRNVIEQWMTVIYAGMIAEENKANAILKKRIKRLGMYQVLIENRSAKESATFSYGKKWRELDKIMKEIGI